MGLGCLLIPPGLSKVSISSTSYTGPALPHSPPGASSLHTIAPFAPGLLNWRPPTLGQHLLGPSPFLCEPGPSPQDTRLLRSQLLICIPHPWHKQPAQPRIAKPNVDEGRNSAQGPETQELIATQLGWAPKLLPVPEQPLSLLIQDFAPSFLLVLLSTPTACNSSFRAKERLSEAPPSTPWVTEIHTRLPPTTAFLHPCQLLPSAHNTLHPQLSS